MFHFTKEEKIVLLLLGAVLLLGSTLHIAFKKYPYLKDIMHFMDSDRAYQKVDLNTASFEELVSIPYIGEYTAQNIIEYRHKHGPFTSIEQVKSVKGIKEKNYGRFSSFLKISGTK